MEEARLRFFKKVNKTDTCWLWTGSQDTHGYGHLRHIEQTYKSHRFSWLLAGNTIPEGHLIRHKCRNRHCVNPEHLETGTHQDNMHDRIRDGTLNDWSKGVNHSMVKLTEDQVRAIRANQDNKTYTDLGKEYGVNRTTISKIILRKMWKHL